MGSSGSSIMARSSSRPAVEKAGILGPSFASLVPCFTSTMTSATPAPTNRGTAVSFGPLLASIQAKCASSPAAVVKESETEGLDHDDVVEDAQDSQETDVIMEDETVGDLDDIYMPEEPVVTTVPDDTPQPAATGRRLTRSATAKSVDPGGEQPEPENPSAPPHEQSANVSTPPKSAAKGYKKAATPSKLNTGDPSVVSGSTSPAPPVESSEAPPPDPATGKKEKRAPGRPPKKPHECPTEDLCQKVAALSENVKSHDAYTKSLATSLATARRQGDEKQKKIDAQQKKIEAQQRKIEEQQKRFEEQHARLEKHIKSMDAQRARLDECFALVNSQQLSLGTLDAFRADMVRRMAVVEQSTTTTTHELEHHFLPIVTDVDAFMGTTKAQLLDLEGDVTRALDYGGQLSDIALRLRTLEGTSNDARGLGKRPRVEPFPAPTATPTPPHLAAGHQDSPAHRNPSRSAQRPQPPAYPSPTPLAGSRGNALLRVGPIAVDGRAPFIAFRSYMTAIPGGDDMITSVGRVRMDPDSSEFLMATINPPEQAERIKVAWNSFTFPRAQRRPFANVSYQGN